MDALSRCVEQLQNVDVTVSNTASSFERALREWPHLYPLLKIHKNYKFVAEARLNAVKERQLREKVDRAERLSSYPQAVVSQLEAQLEEYQQAAERLAASLSASIDKKCKTEQEEEIAMLERLRDDHTYLINQLERTETELAEGSKQAASHIAALESVLRVEVREEEALDLAQAQGVPVEQVDRTVVLTEDMLNSRIADNGDMRERALELESAVMLAQSKFADAVHMTGRVLQFTEKLAARKEADRTRKQHARELMAMERAAHIARLEREVEEVTMDLQRMPVVAPKEKAAATTSTLGEAASSSSEKENEAQDQQQQQQQQQQPQRLRLADLRAVERLFEEKHASMKKADDAFNFVHTSRAQALAQLVSLLKLTQPSPSVAAVAVRIITRLYMRTHTSNTSASHSSTSLSTSTSSSSSTSTSTSSSEARVCSLSALRAESVLDGQAAFATAVQILSSAQIIHVDEQRDIITGIAVG